ncbi:putative endonuclease [Tamilnaduibacter salinus]|uniref:UPF0102 protein C8D92_10115 n=1 Tax=Tamilnaduibacter salinus TaxID=1484056 RepID=A0A2A2I201_9GAMM|nr:YraN family protein [Tamilnaduibacter salinus]PAV26051.1 YraN family protein [Tamilnaduibacter salinus]PVY78813.1 putative endonuclease [Tamilnaduibacter salinus]
MTQQPREGRRQTGQAAEEAAERYLRRRGLRIVSRNFHCRGGEVDIIGYDEKQLVFVEVRYRGQGSLEGALESVTVRKQQRLIRAASWFLQRHRLWDTPCRFDVLAMTPGRIRRYRAQWIQNAFQVTD